MEEVQLSKHRLPEVIWSAKRVLRVGVHQQLAVKTTTRLPKHLPVEVGVV